MANYKKRPAKPRKSKKELNIPQTEAIPEGTAIATDEEIEKVVLGAVLLEGSRALIKVINILGPKAFYFEHNKIIYQTMLSMYDEGKPIDIVTICRELQKLGLLDQVGGAFYVASLTSRVATASNIEAHSRILTEMAMERGLIEIASKVSKKLQEPGTDVFDIMEEMNKDSFDLMTMNIKQKERGVEDIFKELKSTFNNIMGMEDGKVTGFPTNLRAVDQMTNGFQKSDLIVLAARPAMGKTALLKQFLIGGCFEKQESVLLFSLEMSATQQFLRIISEEIGLPAKDIMKKSTLTDYITYDKIMQVKEKFKTKDGKDLIIIDDSAGLSITELSAKAKKICAENRIGCIGIDYLQLMNDGGVAGSNRQVEVSNIAKGLKNLAKDLNIPVIALSQLSRSTEQNPNKKPTLANLNESGAIEAAADVVMFLWRGDYYYHQGNAAFETVEHCVTKEQINSNGYAEVIFAKHRNGDTGTVPLRFEGSTTKFSDWGSNPFQPNNFSDNPFVENYNQDNSLSRFSGADEF